VQELGSAAAFSWPFVTKAREWSHVREKRWKTVKNAQLHKTSRLDYHADEKNPHSEK
jgi:hypothetical protein